MSRSNVDILIIGARPAGLMAALCAASYGLEARIIDKRPKKLEVGFGDGMFTRTMEILDSFGLANKVFDAGVPLTGMHIWVFILNLRIILDLKMLTTHMNRSTITTQENCAAPKV